MRLSQVISNLVKKVELSGLNFALIALSRSFLVRNILAAL